MPVQIQVKESDDDAIMDFEWFLVVQVCRGLTFPFRRCYRFFCEADVVTIAGVEALAIVSIPFGFSIVSKWLT